MNATTVSPDAERLSLDAGTGNITLSGTIGTATESPNRLQDLTITTSGMVAIEANVFVSRDINLTLGNLSLTGELYVEGGTGFGVLNIHTPTGGETIGLGTGAGDLSISTAELQRIRRARVINIGEQGVQYGLITATGAQFFGTITSLESITISSDNTVGGIALDYAVNTALDINGNENTLLTLNTGEAGITANNNGNNASIAHTGSGSSILLRTISTVATDLGEAGENTRIVFANNSVPIRINNEYGSGQVALRGLGSLIIDGGTATVTGDRTLNIDTSAGDLILSQQINAGGGNVTLSPLENLVFNFSADPVISQTMANLTVSSQVVLEQDAEIFQSAGHVDNTLSFEQTINSGTSARSLTINSGASNIELLSSLGDTNALSLLTINSDGLLEINDIGHSGNGSSGVEGIVTVTMDTNGSIDFIGNYYHSSVNQTWQAGTALNPRALTVTTADIEFITPETLGMYGNLTSTVAGNNVTIRSNDIALNPGGDSFGTWNLAANTLYLYTEDSNVPMNFGVDTAGEWSLDDSELASLNMGATHGAIVLGEDGSQAAQITIHTVNLAASNTDTGTNLTVHSNAAGGSILLENAPGIAALDAGVNTGNTLVLHAYESILANQEPIAAGHITFSGTIDLRTDAGNGVSIGAAPNGVSEPPLYDDPAGYRPIILNDGYTEINVYGLNSSGVWLMGNPDALTLGIVDIGGSITTDIFAGSGTIYLTKDIASSGQNISFLQPVRLRPEVGSLITIDTRTWTSAPYGNLTFQSTLDDDDAVIAGTNSLTIEAGGGAVDFVGAVGNAASDSRPLNDLTVTAGEITVQSGLFTAGNGNVLLTHSGTLTILDTTSAEDTINFDIDLAGTFTSTGTGTVSIAGDIRTAGQNITFNRPVTLTGNVRLDTGTTGGDILFADAAIVSADLDAALADTVDITLRSGTGDIAFGTVGTADPADPQSARIGGVDGSAPIGRLIIETANDVTFTGRVAAQSFRQDAGTDTTLFRSPVDTLGSDGFTFTGTNLDFNNTGDTSQVNLTTQGGGDMTVTHSGILYLRDRTDMNDTDTIDYEIDGVFEQVQTTGTTMLAGEIRTADSNIIFNGPIELSGNVLLESGSGDIRFENLATIQDDAVPGTANLILNSDGLTLVATAVGAGGREITSLTTKDSGGDATSNNGTVQITGGAIHTTGLQTYNNSVVLGADLLLRSTAGGVDGTIDFTHTLNAGDRDVTLHADIADAPVYFRGAVSNLGSGSGDSLMVQNGQTGLVRFYDTLQGSNGLHAEAGTNLRFDGDVNLSGGVANNAIPVNQLLGNVHLSGISLTVDRSLGIGSDENNQLILSDESNPGVTTQNSIALTGVNSTFDMYAVTDAAESAATNGSVFTLNSESDIIFHAAIGGTEPLSSITADIAGTLRFAENVTSAGGQTLTANLLQTNAVHTTANADINITAAIELESDSEFNTGSAAGAVFVNGTVDSIDPEQRALSVDSGTGDIRFTGAIGATQKPGSLTLTADSAATPVTSITFDSSVDTVTEVVISGGSLFTNDRISTEDGTFGRIEVTAHTRLQSDTMFDVAADLTFYGPIDSATDPRVLTLRASEIDLREAAGADTPLNYIHLERAVGLINASSADAVIDLRHQDLYIDAPGSTGNAIQLMRNLHVDRFVFYRGELDLNGQALTAESDFVVFGPAYDPHDADLAVTSPGNIYFAYPTPHADSLHYYPDRGSYDNSTAQFSDAGGDLLEPDSTWASFSDLGASTITVGSSGGGNFFVNGANLTGTANWTLNVLDTDPPPAGTAVDALDNPDFLWGEHYNTVFFSDVSFSQVTGGVIQASVSLDGSEGAAYAGQAEVNNGVEDLGGNLLYSWYANGDRDTVGWNFGRPRIESAETVFDNVIRVTFTQPIANRNNEINRILDGLEWNNNTAEDGGIWLNNGDYVFTEAFVDLEVNGSGDLANSTDGEGDLLTFYLQVQPANSAEAAEQRWNTDATGDSEGDWRSTDRGRGEPGDPGYERPAHRETVPDITILKGVLRSAGGRAAVRNYNLNNDPDGDEFAVFDDTADETRPVLISVTAGRSPHQKNLSDPDKNPYDAHNYLHLRYSEPVSIGNATHLQIGNNDDLDKDDADRRTQTSFDNADEWGGHGRTIEIAGADYAEIVGYLQYPGRLDMISRDEGQPSGSEASNSIFRRNNTDGAENPSVDHGLTIYIAGWSFLDVDGAGVTRRYWPGAIDPEHSTLEQRDPVDELVIIPPNPYITDAEGNSLEHTDGSGYGKARIQIEDNPTNIHTGGSLPATMPAGDLSGWDVDPPDFAVYQFSNPGGPLFHEIISLVSPVTSLVNRLEFHVLDNSIDNDDSSDDFWVGQLGEHPREFANQGLRDTSTAFPDSLIEYRAFRIEEQGIEPLVNTFNLGISSDVNNPAFDEISVRDDAYIALLLQDSGHPWGLITPLYVSYTREEAWITDLAGNLLPSSPEPMRIIERTPPRILLSVAPLSPENSSNANQRVLVRFSKPVYGNMDGSVEISAADFEIRTLAGNPAAGISIEALEIVDSRDEGSAVPGAMDAVLLLSRAIEADDLFELVIVSRPADTDLGTGVYDISQNPMLSSRFQRISNVALGLIQPVYAVDRIRMDVSGDPLWESGSLPEDESYASPAPVTVFDGSQSLTADQISLQARLHSGLSGSNRNQSVGLYYDVNADESLMYGSLGQLWLPIVEPGLIDFPNTSARLVNPFSINGLLRSYRLNIADERLRPSSELSFLFRVGSLFSVDHELPAGGEYRDVDDFLSMRPWKIGIERIIEQRAGVTILNNVINPDIGDRTILQYRITEPGSVTIQVFNLAGDLINVLHRGPQGSGMHTVSWDGTNMGGRAVTRGIYFIRVVAPGIDEYRRVMVVR
ncbi:beta strand repeat-containing protein [Spirochaeta dissipatitropha]